MPFLSINRKHLRRLAQTVNIIFVKEGNSFLGMNKKRPKIKCFQAFVVDF